MAAGADLRAPHALFRPARAIGRRIVFHVGPTNSGKTHAALRALTDSGSGVYCGPLRLLAAEARDRIAGASGIVGFDFLLDTRSARGWLAVQYATDLIM